MKKVKVGATVCELKDLLFKVKVIDEKFKCNTEYSKRIFGLIDGEAFLLNQCSNRYALVKNRTIFPTIEKTLKDASIEFTVTYTHINHVRFYADYTITDKRYAYKMEGTNDTIMPMLRVQHSYNGLTKYRIIFGYFRMVCTNGLTVPVEQMKEFNLVIVGKHTESIKHSFSKLAKMLENFKSNAKVHTSIINKFEQLGGKWIENPEDRLKEVLNANKIIIVENNKFNTLTDILNRISLESNMVGLGYNGRVNDWLIYNGINRYLNDDSRNIATPETRMEKDSKVLEYMLKTV